MPFREAKCRAPQTTSGVRGRERLCSGECVEENVETAVFLTRQVRLLRGCEIENTEEMRDSGLLMGASQTCRDKHCQHPESGT
jgi:hypothetical protein